MNFCNWISASQASSLTTFPNCCERAVFLFGKTNIWCFSFAQLNTSFKSFPRTKEQCVMIYVSLILGRRNIALRFSFLYSSFFSCTQGSKKLILCWNSFLLYPSISLGKKHNWSVLRLNPWRWLWKVKYLSLFNISSRHIEL